jgi:hypothetical protein
VTKMIGIRTVGGPTTRFDVRWAIAARMTDLLVPGLYAWAVTVAWPILVRPSVSLARSLVFLSVSALLCGSALSVRWPAPARILGVWSFVALCTGAWASAKLPAGAPLLDPVQGIAGSLGWALFALGWASDGEAVRRAAGPSVRAERSFSPRSRPWSGAPLVVAFAIAAAAVLLGIAFWVSGRARASFAHAAAISGAVALVGAAAEIVVRQRPAKHQNETGGGSRIESVGWRAGLDGAKAPLILVATLALLGVAYTLTS